MNKKLLSIAIILIILAVVTAPAAAVLPVKSPLPPGYPFDKIWNLVKDLQTQISNIQLTPGPQRPPGPAGATELKDRLGHREQLLQRFLHMCNLERLLTRFQDIPNNNMM